jgi:hypothetical protein
METQTRSLSSPPSRARSGRTGALLFRLLVLSAIGAAPPIAGCASMSDVIHEKQSGGGTAVAYPVGKDDAWKIAMAAFRWGGADAIEEHKDAGYMLTSSGASVGTKGTMMGVWVEPIGLQQSRVTVVTKRRIAVQAITTLTESGFHERFRQGVGILASGQSLPIEAPAL